MDCPLTAADVPSTALLNALADEDRLRILALTGGALVTATSTWMVPAPPARGEVA